MPATNPHHRHETNAAKKRLPVENVFLSDEKLIRPWLIFVSPFLVLGVVSILVSLAASPEHDSWRDLAREIFQEPLIPVRAVIMGGLSVCALLALNLPQVETNPSSPVSRRELANRVFRSSFLRTSALAAGVLLALFGFWAVFLHQAEQEFQVDLLLPHLRGLAWCLLWIPLGQTVFLESRSPRMQEILSSMVSVVILIGMMEVLGLALPEVGSWRPALWLFVFGALAQGLLWLALHRYFRLVDLSDTPSQEPMRRPQEGDTDNPPTFS